MSTINVFNPSTGRMHVVSGSQTYIDQQTKLIGQQSRAARESGKPGVAGRFISYNQAPSAQQVRAAQQAGKKVFPGRVSDVKAPVTKVPVFKGSEAQRRAVKLSGIDPRAITLVKVKGGDFQVEYDKSVVEQIKRQERMTGVSKRFVPSWSMREDLKRRIAKQSRLAKETPLKKRPSTDFSVPAYKRKSTVEVALERFPEPTQKGLEQIAYTAKGFGETMFRISGSLGSIYGEALKKSSAGSYVQEGVQRIIKGAKMPVPSIFGVSKETFPDKPFFSEDFRSGKVSVEQTKKRIEVFGGELTQTGAMFLPHIGVGIVGAEMLALKEKGQLAEPLILGAVFGVATKGTSKFFGTAVSKLPKGWIREGTQRAGDFVSRVGVPAYFGFELTKGVGEFRKALGQDDYKKASLIGKQIRTSVGAFAVGERFGRTSLTVGAEGLAIGKGVLFKDFYKEWQFDPAKQTGFGTRKKAVGFMPPPPRLKAESIPGLKKAEFIPKPPEKISFPVRTALEKNTKSWLKKNENVALKGSRNLYLQSPKPIEFSAKKDFDFAVTKGSAKVEAKEYVAEVLKGKGSVKKVKATFGDLYRVYNAKKKAVADFVNQKVPTVKTKEGISLVRAKEEIYWRWLSSVKSELTVRRREKDLPKLLEALDSYTIRTKKGKEFLKKGIQIREEPLFFGEKFSDPVYYESRFYHVGSLGKHLKGFLKREKTFEGEIKTPTEFEKMFGLHKQPVTFMAPDRSPLIFRKDSPDVLLTKGIKQYSITDFPSKFWKPAVSDSRAITQAKDYLKFLETHKKFKEVLVPSPSAVTGRLWTGKKTDFPEMEKVIFGKIRNIQETGFAFDPTRRFGSDKVLKIYTNYPKQSRTALKRIKSNVQLMFESYEPRYAQAREKMLSFDLGLPKTKELSRLEKERKVFSEKINKRKPFVLQEAKAFRETKPSRPVLEKRLFSDLIKRPERVAQKQDIIRRKIVEREIKRPGSRTPRFERPVARITRIDRYPERKRPPTRRIIELKRYPERRIPERRIIPDLFRPVRTPRIERRPEPKKPKRTIRYPSSRIEYELRDLTRRKPSGSKAFDVFVKTQKGMKNIGAGLTKRSAFGLGIKETKHTAKRTFEVLPSSFTGKPKELSFAFDPHSELKKMFRKPVKKGKTLIESPKYIEKVKYAIDTPGELREITYKGIKAKKTIKKRRKKK